MITMRTDYSPAAAQEKQEEENVRMIQMLLVIAGLSTKELVMYNKASTNAVNAYEEALGEPEQEQERGRNTHSQEQWDAAKLAAETHIDAAGDILKDAGVTIVNKLEKSEDEHVFSHIITTVYNDYGPNPVAQIVRAIVDIESDTYQDNVTGYGLTTKAA